MTNREYLSTKQVAMILGVSVSTVQNLVERGILQAWKTSGGHRRIHQDSLKELQQKYGVQNGPAQNSVSTVPKSATKPLVLVVEDDPFMLEIYQNALGKYNESIDTKYCNEGISALLQIGAQKPDLLILDLNMPGVDGFAVLKSIKALTQTSGMRVLVVSGLHDRELAKHHDLLRSFSLMKKPLSADFLHGYISCFIALTT